MCCRNCVDELLLCHRSFLASWWVQDERNWSRKRRGSLGSLHWSETTFRVLLLLFMQIKTVVSPLVNPAWIWRQPDSYFSFSWCCPDVFICNSSVLFAPLLCTLYSWVSTLFFNGLNHSNWSCFWLKHTFWSLWTN